MKHAGNMILYRNLEQGQIFDNMTWIMEHYDSDYYNRRYQVLMLRELS